MSPTPPTPRHRFFQGPQPTGEYSFFQVAWIVPDLIAACRQWVDVFGAGPFKVLPKRTGKVRYRGRETDLEMQLAVTQVGPVHIELIQQTSETESVYRDIFPEGSGGLHHMCTLTDNFAATKAHYTSLGHECVAEISGALTVGYFDTYKDFGFITEVVERNEDFVRTLAESAAECANWDGTDPIRILHRGGYTVPD